MPQAYDVNWGVDPANSWSDKVGGQLRAALQARQEKQLQEAAQARAAEEEQYKRQQDALENERKAQADARAKEAHDFDVRAAKIALLDAQHKQKTNVAKFELENRERQQKEALEQGQQFRAVQPDAAPSFEASQTAPVAPGAAPMDTPDTPEERAAFAASQPAEVVQPAIPGINPGDPNVAEERTLNPGLLAQAAEAMRARAASEKAAQIGAEETARGAAREPFQIADDQRTAALQEKRDQAAFSRADVAANRAEAAKGAKRTESLRKEYNRESRKYAEALADLDRYSAPVLTGRAEGRKQTPADEFALIYAFNKALDPTSVVRESEFKNTKGVGAGISDRAYQLLQNWRNGKQLTDEQVEQMLDALNRAKSATVTSLNDINARYRDLSMGLDIDPDLVIRPETGTQAPETPGTKPAAATVIRYDAQGNRIK